MSVPKPRPSAWFGHCQCGDETARFQEGDYIQDSLCRACMTHSHFHGRRTALWGHEWAAVAWMALSEAHLEDVFKDTGEQLSSGFLGDRLVEGWMQR